MCEFIEFLFIACSAVLVTYICMRELPDKEQVGDSHPSRYVWFIIFVGWSICLGSSS